MLTRSCQRYIRIKYCIKTNKVLHLRELSIRISSHGLLAGYWHLNAAPYLTRFAPPVLAVTLLFGAPTNTLWEEIIHFNQHSWKKINQWWREVASLTLSIYLIIYFFKIYFFIFFLQTCDWQKSIKIATHPSEPTMVSETPRNQCFGLCIKMTIIIIAIIYPRHLFYSTNASGAKKIPETKSQSNLTRLRIPTGRGQNGYLQL